MKIALSDYPQLKLIAWNRSAEDFVSDWEALALYERNWDLVDKESLEDKERQLIEHLTKTVGNGVFHV